MRRCAVLLPLLLVALLYGQTLSFRVLSDDRLVFEELKLHEGNPLAIAFGQPLVFNPAYYRPLPTVVLLGAVKASGGYALSHAISVALLAINVALVLWLARLLTDKLSPGNPLRDGCAVLASLCYAAHPAAAEATAWISSLYDLSVTCFVLLSLCLAWQVRRPWLRQIGIFTCVLCASLSKESAIVFLPVYLLIDILTHGHAGFVVRNRITVVTVTLATALYLALRHQVLGSILPATGTATALAGTTHHLLFVYKTIGLYVERIAVPFFDTRVFHTVRFGRPLVDLDCALGLVAIALPLILLQVARQAALALLVVLVALLPVSNLLVIPSAYGDINDRYLALPLALFAALAAALSCRVASSLAREARIAAGIGILFYASALSVATAHIVPHYRNSETYWTWAADTHPDIPALRLNLVNELYRQQRYADARQQLEAIRKRENNFFTSLYLGRLALLDGDYPAAEPAFTAALEQAKSSDDLAFAQALLAFSELLQDNDAGVPRLDRADSADQPATQLIHFFAHCRNGDGATIDSAILHDLNPQVLQEYDDVVRHRYPQCVL